MTERKVGEAGSRGQQAEALVRAGGAREQAAILDQAASAQEAALRAFETVQSVTADDARDPEIGPLIRDLYDVDKEMRAAGGTLAAARADAEALVSERLALVARQGELSALEAGRQERLKAARQKLEGSRARQRTESERLIVLAAQGIYDRDPAVFVPELAEALLGIGTARSDDRFLPFAAALLMDLERLFPEAISNSAQREAVQRLTDALTAYFEMTLGSANDRTRRSAENLIQTLRHQAQRDLKERPLGSAVLQSLLAAAAPAPHPSSSASSPAARPFLLSDPGLEDRWSVSNMDHREEWSQIKSVLEPIRPRLTPKERQEIRDAFASGNLASVLLLMSSNDEELAVAAARQLSVQSEHRQLLFQVARDPNVSSKTRAAAIEGLALKQDPSARRLAPNDPILRLLDELIASETKDPATGQPKAGDPIVLSRLARLAGTLSPSEALPFLERILGTGQPAPVYAAALEIRAQTPHPDALKPLLDTLASGPYRYSPVTRERVLSELGLWSDRSPVQHALVEAVLDLSDRFASDPVVRAAIDEHQQSALKEHRLGFVEYVLNPARGLADPARPMAVEEIWSRTGVWFYNRLDLFAAVVLSVAGIAVLLALSRKVRQDVEGERAVPPVLDYDDPHHPGSGGARMAELDLDGEAERILMQTLDRRFGPATAEMIRVQMGHTSPPSDDAGWMELFPDFGTQILSELRSIRTNPIDLIEFRVQEWERVLDSSAHVSPGELSASIFSLVQQLTIRLPRKFDYRNFYMKLDDTRDGVINIRMVARTVNALSRIDDLLRREWKMTLEGRTSVLDRDQRVWSLMALQRQFMKAYRAFGAAQELFEIAHVAQTYNDYQMHPWLMRLFVFEKVRRTGIQLLAHGPRDPKRPHLKGVLDDYYRAVGRVVGSEEIERDVVEFFDEFTEEYQRELEEARKQGFVLFTGRVVGRRYRRLITVLMPAVGIAAGFLLGGPVFGLPAIFRAFFLGSLGILASRWIHSESFYKPLRLNYEHYVSTVVDMLEERNRLFAAKFHISEHAAGPRSGTYIESDEFVAKMLLNSTKERRQAVINLVAADRPADLLIVMIGEPAGRDWHGVRNRVLNHDLIVRSDTPVVFVPDDPGLKGSYYAFLKAHSYLAGGVSTADVVQRFLNEPWFLELNGHLLNAAGDSVRDDVRERLLRDHHRKVRASENPARVGVLYAGGGQDHLDRVAEHVDEAVVRLHAGLLWAYHSKSFAIASEYADGRYAGPLPFYDHTQLSDLDSDEVLIPLTWVNSAQLDRERSAVFLPDRTGRSIAAVIPGGINADERRTRMNRAWMTAESPFTKSQVGSDAAQFLTDTGAFFFSPADGTLERLRDQRDRILREPAARLEAQRQDRDGYTVERFFIGSLDEASRVRLRAAITPPDAARYDHLNPLRSSRGQVFPVPPAPSVPAGDRTIPLIVPQRPAPIDTPGLTLPGLPPAQSVPPAPAPIKPHAEPVLPDPPRRVPARSIPIPPTALPVTVQAPPHVPAPPSEPYKVQIKLDGSVVLSQPGAAINGQPVALNKLAGGSAFTISIPGSHSYELRWADPDQQRLLLIRDGSPVALSRPDAYTFQRMKNLLPSGARFALVVGIVAGSEAEFEKRADAVRASVSAAGVVRPVDMEWVDAAAPSADVFMRANSSRDKVLLDEGAFLGAALADAEVLGAQIKSIVSRETRALETLLKFILAAEAKGRDLDDAAIDAWMDAVTSPGALPAVEPMSIEARTGGYTFRSSAELPAVSAQAAAVKLGDAFTGSDSYAAAREKAIEAARSIEQSLRLGADRSEVRGALKGLAAVRRAGAAERTELSSAFGPGIGDDGGKIYIEEALFMENQGAFEAEDRALEQKLRTAGKDIRRAIVAELTEEWRSVAASDRQSAYLAARNIRGGFEVVFVDPKSAAGVFGNGEKPQALLTRYASPLANSDLPRNTSVIEPIAAEDTGSVGILFAAARLLIERNDRLPGMKKFAEGRYFYLPPLSAGALLRAVMGVRLSAEAAATAA